MLMPYRVDFFGRDFTYHGWSLIQDPEIEFDYLTLDSSKIVIPSLKSVNRGWYAHITRGGKTVFDGIVSAVSDNGTTVEVSVKPLLSLLQIEVYKAASAYTGAAENFIASILNDVFVSNADTVERIPGFTISTTSSTSGVPLSLDDNFHDLYADIIIPALENGQIVVTMSLNPQTHELNCAIGKAPPTAIKVAADVKGIIDKSFSFRDDYGSVNKVIVYNEENESQNAIFYATDYAAPTVRKIVKIRLSDGDVWLDKAQEAANKELEKRDFDNMIELSFPVDFKLVPDVAIGQEMNVYHDGKKYVSFLTGIKEADGIITLTCGSVRIDLTKILTLEGRK